MSPSPSSEPRSSRASRLPVVDARAFFEAIARRYDRVYALSGATSKARLARVLAAIAGKTRVLVLGVGTGRELPALLDAGHAAVGLDLAPAMLAELARRARTIPTVVSDFWEPLPFADGSFDAVLALHGTLAHPPGDPATAIARLGAEVARVLRPAGVFVAEVPAGERLDAIAAPHQDEPVRARALSATHFLHEDDVAAVALEGVALHAESWSKALSPSLEVEISPLPPLEHFIRAVRHEEPR